jgi:hypothetical protein
MTVVAMVDRQRLMVEAGSLEAENNQTQVVPQNDTQML